jgi:hypothetical protein
VVCHWLVEGLVSRGHEVTLVAAGEPRPGARLLDAFQHPPSGRVVRPCLSCCMPRWRPTCWPTWSWTSSMTTRPPGLLTALGRRVPSVVTAHGPTEGEPGRYYAALADRVALVAISQAQRRLLPDVAWAGVVYYGIPVGQHPYRADKQDFALFLGRMGPDKGAHLAIAATGPGRWACRWS